MKKRMALGSLLVIGIVVFLVVMINQNPGLSQENAYIYSSSDAALVEGVNEITGDNQNIETISSWILDTRKNGNKEYCLLAVPYEEAGIQKHYSFVVLVDESGGKYGLFKLTADVSLNSPGGVQDQQKSDSLVFFFDDVNGYYICVGKVFRDDVVPFADGRPLALNQNGIFSYFNKGKRPEISIQKP